MHRRRNTDAVDEPNFQTPYRDPLGDLRFAQILTQPVWETLPSAIRKRFGKRLNPGQSVVYRGHLIQTRMNRMGKILAQLLRAIGAPLPLECGRYGAAAVVTVTEAHGGHGQFWTRQYNRQKGFPQVIHSTKSFTGPTGLEEQIGFGIGMTLDLKAERDSLIFSSNRYFIGGFRWRVYLPKWICPGDLVVGHHDCGDGQFDFTLDLNHALFGELLSQKARFCDT